MNEVPWTNASTIGSEAAHQTWALAARMGLEETARTYHAVMTYQEIADYAIQRSRIRTQQAMRYWIGDVLFRLMSDCAEKGEPLLGSLVVNASGQVGEGYQVAVEELRGEVVGDRDEHAARERLECYRFFGATLPDDGGVPGPLPTPRRARASTGERSPRTTSAARTRATSATRPTTRPARRPEPVVQVCPRCYLALPASGHCDFCD